MPALWYRHWLEIRAALPATALFAAIVVVIAGPDPQHGPLARALFENRLAGSISAQELSVWASVTRRICIGAWLLAFSLGGNGVYPMHLRRDGSVYYTLTLPTPRSRLLWTRQLAGCAASVVFLAGMVAAYSGVVWTMGGSVPVTALAASIAFAAPVLMTWTAVIGALFTMMNAYWTALAATVLFVASLAPTIDAVAAFPAEGEVPWLPLAGMLPITALALLFAIRKTGEREF